MVIENIIWIWPKCKRIKDKKKKRNWSYIKLKSISTAKEKKNNKKSTKWKKTFANNSFNKGLYPKCTKNLCNSSPKKSDLKNGQRTWTTLLPRIANKCMKRRSTLLAVREMQLQTTIRYHIIPDRMAIINKSSNNNCWRGCGEKKKEHSFTADWNVNWYSHYGKEYSSSSKN